MALDEEHHPLSAEALEGLYEAKAAAELADASGATAGALKPWRGEPLGRLAFVISTLSDEDLAAGEPLRGAAGEAADKSAIAFGVGADGYFVAVSRPDGEPSTRLAQLLEAADPSAIIALDDTAASDLESALGIGRLEQGVPVRVNGRVIGAAGDLAGSLNDPDRKKRVWASMKSIAAEAGLRT